MVTILVDIDSEDKLYKEHKNINLQHYDLFLKDENNISNDKLYETVIYTIQKQLRNTLTQEELVKHDIFNIFLLYKLINKHLGLEEFLITTILEKSYSSINSEFIKILFHKDCVRDINKYLDEPLSYSTFLQLKNSKEKDFNNKLLFDNYYSFFTFDFMDKDGIRVYSDLSHGEKTFYNQILNINSELMKDKNDFLICLDEPELSLHPKWQKEYLQKFIKAVKGFKNIHLVISSHSPFLISDLPKENIIFLDTYKKDEEDNQKEGNCKNVTEVTNINPFGANIHTLLSDGFFMKDGLMGEFAKNKIEEVVNFLNDEENEIKNYEEAQKIIDIVGEPVLKMKLQRMLENYKKKHNLENEEDIKKQIEELQKKLEEKQNNG